MSGGALLTGLSVRDIVLIDRIDLALTRGLCVFTGETGAGKSILLDALGLALGRRADIGLVRHGTERGSVTATFDLSPSHPARDALIEHGLDSGDVLVLRRVLGADGKSRAFIDDQPVGVALLRRVGDMLVEIHGQNDEQGLLDANIHRAMLDEFAGLRLKVAAVRAAHATWRSAAVAAAAAAASIEAAKADEDYLRHVVGELAELNPLPGEEAKLSAIRALLQNGGKIAEALSDALIAFEQGGGVEGRLRQCLRALERVADRAGGKLDAARQAAERALSEAGEASAALAAAGTALDLDPRRLDAIEERLFALRAAARKHRVSVDELANLRDELSRRLGAIADSDAMVERLNQAAAAARANYVASAEALYTARLAGAAMLDKAVAIELKPLKLGAVRFITAITPMPEADWSVDGMDRVQFQVATNPGGPAGPLNRIASGGELSRFMLALKVTLAGQGDAATLVFDEVDRGVGGATADAVGERLARLAGQVQVLAVTHSPQVAARADHHWRVGKTMLKGKTNSTVTVVEPLDARARREEIARMLAGASVTDEARAAAASLIQGGRG